MTPVRAPDRIAELAPTLNEAVFGAWACAQLRLAGGILSTGCATPALRQTVARTLATIRDTHRGSSIAELAADALHHIAAAAPPATDDDGGAAHARSMGIGA